MILKYPGGKYYLAKQLCEMMAPHKIYIEPFFASESVFFTKQSRPNLRTNENGLSNIDPEVINFWSFLRDHPDTMQKALSAVPYSRKAFEIWRDDAVVKPNTVIAAMKFFILRRMSRSAMGKDFSISGRQRRGMEEGESSYFSAIASFEQGARILDQAAIQVHDAIKIVEFYKDNPAVLMYLDPPYVTGTRATSKIYNFEMTDEQHMSLLTACQDAKAKILISGYDCPLYRSLLKDWTLRKFDRVNRMAQHDSLPVSVECVWRNYW